VSASSSDRLRARLARLRLVLAVTRCRVLDRLREVWTGRRRRWDHVPPPEGARPTAYVLVRGTSAPIPLLLAGDEYALPPAPVAWARSAYWTQPEREPVSPYDWKPMP
jgi:hypothetical protein